MSDHLPIYLIKKKVNLLEEKTSFIGRDYTLLNTDVFKEGLLSMPQDNVLSESNNSTDNSLVYGKIAANEINRYFCNISVELEANLPANTNSAVYPSEASKVNIEILDLITLNELLKEIKAIDISKSSGFQGITT